MDDGSLHGSLLDRCEEQGQNAGDAIQIGTSNVAQYQLEQYIPRLEGRVVDIIPDAVGSGTGKGILKIAKEWHATTDTIPRLEWPVLEERAAPEEHIRASYQGVILNSILYTRYMGLPRQPLISSF
jgi:hypothetical protein